LSLELVHSAGRQIAEPYPRAGCFAGERKNTTEFLRIRTW
jgi:hypothetical protein